MPSETTRLLGSQKDKPKISENEKEYSQKERFLEADVSTEKLQDQSGPPINNATIKEVNIVSNYDDVLPYLGDIGVWQAVTVILLGVMAMDGGILVLLQNFTALEPEKFRCAISECDSPYAMYSDLQFRPIMCDSHKYTKTDLAETNGGICWKTLDKVNGENLSEPTNLNNNNIKCYKPILILSNQTQTPQPISNCSLLTSDLISGTEICEVTDPAKQIIYEPYEYKTTIVTEFNLVCDQQYKIALSGTFYMIGLLIGSFIGGLPSDAFGRKPVLFFFLICGGEYLYEKFNIFYAK